jgi:hypothetical protein
MENDEVRIEKGRGDLGWELRMKTVELRNTSEET